MTNPVSSINKENDGSRIFVFISYDRSDINNVFLQFTEKCGYSVLTCKEKVYDLCRQKNINVNLLPSNPRKFKSSIKHIEISFIILAGDSYDGRHNYLARHYKSAFIQGLSFNSRHYWEKTAARETKSFYLWAYKMLGLTGILFGRDMVLYEKSLKGILRALIEKINWGLKPVFFLHGYHCDLIFLQENWEKEIWINNGIPEDKVRLAGIIKTDWILDNLLKQSNSSSIEYPSSDLLFFSQPLYQYAGEPKFLEELELLVNECRKSNLKLQIKLHPRDDIQIYKRFESDTCSIIQHKKNWSDADNVALIKQTKVVMGKGSTSMLVSLLLQKPVMYLDLFDSDFVHFKYFLKPRLLLKKIEEFNEMYSFAANPENLEFIQAHQSDILSNFGHFDGQCWKRIKDEISRFLEKQ